MDRCSLLLFLSCIAGTLSFGQSERTLTSPNGRIVVRVATEGMPAYEVAIPSKGVLFSGTMSFRITGVDWGDPPTLLSATTRKVSEEIRPVVPEKRSIIPNIYNELTLTYRGGLGVEFRAYDDAVVYRFTSNLTSTSDVLVEEESVRWSFAAGDTIFFPQEDGFYGHYERNYSLLDAGNVPDTALCSLPALVTKPNGVRLLLTEADIDRYPGMFLRGTGIGSPALEGVFPRFPLEETARGDRDVVVTNEASYIAKTTGTRVFPWRVVGIAERDADLLTNDVVYRLGRPLALEETSWIKPGKVAWDWWNANNVYGVSFRSGINTETYTYYVEFASRYRIEYVILDEGWSRPGDLNDVNPDMDLPSLFAFAKSRNVGIIPWVLWNDLEQELETALDRFASWGAKGIKVDFMQRHDQRMVEFYERVAREAAKRKLLVDFHGAYKPDGLRRMYPNALTREGVRGAEWNKWSKHITPDHNLTLPFIRMVAGPMDYTPGATMNANATDFQAIFNRPMSQGTRCHQMAMYVVYESPLQMLCDNPSNYLREPGMMDFLSAVPTVWHETIIQEAKVGDFVLMARRNGDAWYIGGMTDWTPRTFELDLGFLSEGEYDFHVWSDGVNADRFGNDVVQGSHVVLRSSKIRVSMASGGGWVGIARPAKR